jgi:tripartite-type tricarboxylate transporter receptor subunit TctC
MKRREMLGLSASALAFGVAGARSSAWAQQYPANDIHMICGFPAGSGADAIVRHYGERVKALSGRTVLVENRPGAGANIAIEYVAKAKPDGYTILVHGGTGLAANMYLYKRPPVENVNAFQVFAGINKQAFMLVVDASKPWKTVQELTAAMKAKGDKATYATSAPPSIVMGAIYKAKTGLTAVDVNYKTSADTLNDLMSGSVDFAFMEPVFSTSQHKAGKLRVLGVSTTNRLSAAPDLPTMTEGGVPMKLDLWWAAMVPSATPKPIVDQLNAWFDQITGSEDTKKFLNGFASDPYLMKPAQAQAQLEKEMVDWKEYLQLAKLEPQG